MKKLILLLSLLLMNVCIAQPPENLFNNSVGVNNNKPSSQEENEEENELDGYLLDSSRKEAFKENKIRVRSDKKISKSINGSTSPSIQTSQSIQSSQIIEGEFRKSKMQLDSRMVKPESQKRMESELDKLAEENKASFEYHLYNYTLGNYDIKLEESLNQAEQIKPNDQRLIVQKVANECVQGDTLSTKLYLQKLINTNALETETLDYAEDVLISSRGNDILITHGTNDTYGVLYHQLHTPKYSSDDVLVISLDFLRSPYYRKLLSGKGLELPTSSTINTDYFKEFCTLNSDKKIAVSLTLPIDYLRRIASFATPYGLVLVTGNQKALCLSDLETLWNEQLNKRNLTSHSSFLSKNYARNYKPSQQLLERFYEQQKTSPYISSPKKLKPHKSKAVTSGKN